MTGGVPGGPGRESPAWQAARDPLPVQAWLRVGPVPGADTRRDGPSPGGPCALHAGPIARFYIKPPSAACGVVLVTRRPQPGACAASLTRRLRLAKLKGPAGHTLAP